MPLAYIDEYKKGNHVFPEDAIPFSSKGEEWHKKYGNAVLADYASNRCGVMYSERDRMITNRQWAEGTNSEDTFKDIILEYQRDEGERQAFSSIDYSIIPIIAKVKSDFIGILSNIDHRATANSIDPISLNKKTKAKETAWIKSHFAEELAPIDAKLGIKPKEGEYIPKTRQELDMYDQFGGFKLALETGLEAGMKHCFEESRWDEEIRPQLLSDVFDNKMMACRDYFDRNTYSVRSEYVDIANVIVQTSNSPTFDTSRYKGFFKFITIADLRVLTEGKNGWNEDKIKKIAKRFASLNGNNPNVRWGAIGDTYGPYGNESGKTYEYDPYLILIAVLEVQSTMFEYDVKRVDEAGNESYYKTDRDRNYNRSDRKSITTPIKVWHKLSMVVGCDEVFDFGLQHDIPRPTYEDARSSFHFYRMKGKSYCERAIPYAKQIQLMYLKIQGLALKAVPPGVAVEYGALKNMILNKKELKPVDILAIYHQTGNLIFKTTNVRGRQEGGGMPPIHELRGSYTLADLVGVVTMHKSGIREIIGIDDQAPQNTNTAYQAKLSSLFTNIALKESFLSYSAIVKATAINSSARLRDLLAYSEKAREIYGPIIGITNMELLNLVSDLPTAQISISIEIEANDEDKQTLIDAAIAAMKPGKEGVPVLRFSDFLFIQRLARTGMIKYGHAYIAHKESEIEKQGVERATQAKEMDTQMATQIAQQKAQDEQQAMQLKTQSEIDAYNSKVDKDMEMEKLKHMHNKEIENMKLMHDSLTKQTAPA